MPKELPLLPALPPLADPVWYLARELEWEASDVRRGRVLVASGLPPLSTVRTLPFVFGVSNSIVNRMRRSPDTYYRSFTLPKRSGGQRWIRAPRAALKVIQRWIHDWILTTMTPSLIATAFVSGRGIFTNAAPHIGKRNLLKTDIVDFFGSVRRQEVESVFSGTGFSSPVAAQLADLTTLQESLPQGAPSSPLLSNLVTRQLDSDLQAFANERQSDVTRYADDLAISSSAYEYGPADLAILAGLLEAHGYQMNESKTHLIGGGYRHVIAGVSTSKAAMYPRSKRREWRAAFHRASQSPAEFTAERGRLLGIAAAVSQYDPATGAEYRAIADQIPL